MNVLILRPRRAGLGDGYGTFGPEGDALALRYPGNARVVEIDAQRVVGTVPIPEMNAKKAERRRQVLAALEAETREIDWFAILCHGWRTGMQLGFDVATAPILANALASRAHQPKVTLYSCSCGSGGDFGFADALRDALCKLGCSTCRVDAHETSGHATKNPYVRRMDGLGSPTGGHGGTWIVQPGTSDWRLWSQAIQGPMRFQFPHLEIAQIHAILERG